MHVAAQHNKHSGDLTAKDSSTSLLPTLLLPKHAGNSVALPAAKARHQQVLWGTVEAMVSTVGLIRGCQTLCPTQPNQRHCGVRRLASRLQPVPPSLLLKITADAVHGWQNSVCRVVMQLPPLLQRTGADSVQIYAGLLGGCPG
jgi:hypothetical protein